MQWACLVPVHTGDLAYYYFWKYASSRCDAVGVALISCLASARTVHVNPQSQPWAACTFWGYMVLFDVNHSSGYAPVYGHVFVGWRHAWLGELQNVCTLQKTACRKNVRPCCMQIMHGYNGLPSMLRPGKFIRTSPSPCGYSGRLILVINPWKPKVSSISKCHEIKRVFAVVLENCEA